MIGRRHPAEMLKKLAVKLILTLVFIVGFSLAHGINLLSIDFSMEPVRFIREYFWFFLYVGIGIIVFVFVDPDSFNKKN